MNHRTNPMKYVISERMFGNVYVVTYSDGSKKYYDAVALGCEWFRMSNDVFYDIYGFNFNPHKYGDLYDRCRKLVHGA